MTEDLSAIAAMARELADLAGREMAEGLRRNPAVSYKPGAGGGESLRDPVSEVDQAVEVMIRERLSGAFPDHDVLGEELAGRPARGSRYLWAVDPVDGTANYINGFPLFSGSVGLLRDGVPVAGAVWCASSHALRAGVYHAAEGGGLFFDGEPVRPVFNPDVRRRIGGFVDASPRSPEGWEARRTGSAAIECAFIAAGLMEVARFERPNVWDVAGGFALVRATGGIIRILGEKGWQDFTRFDAEGDPGEWRHPVILGRAEAVERLCSLDA
ncbi:inositol monophosphatase family protein [Teichococcus oryzae]|uniref:Inositol monophosphatase n=1 Tax=Teichococcus oryzae TaxID=1608942 RepID=A0A5B2THZ8_9PROT|nr:inositol monophosphatase [Pseudoroseomonas oryzae]KAA2213410.1 inositol monophosphatase [Pseudoroseomonas oryzae]